MKPDEMLFQKFLDNSCTTEEAKEVISWINLENGQQIYESQFEKDILFIENGNKFDGDQSVRSALIYQGIQSKIKSHSNTANIFQIRKLSRSWVKIAASILIPILLANALIWYYVSKPDNKIAWQEIYVPKGEKLQVMFQDGTKVWLNSDSKLKYPKEFNGKIREVILDGEAYFTVNKNPRKPFVVTMNDIEIKVTGTSFNVKAYNTENNIITTLDEGSISLVCKNGKKTEYKIMPNQIAVYVKDSSIVNIHSSKKGENSGWKKNKLEFNNIPLEEVAKTIERWYNVQCDIKDSEIKVLYYTISFQNDSLQNVLSGLEKITPVKCDFKNGIVVFKKK